jgi:ribosomal protein L28
MAVTRKLLRGHYNPTSKKRKYPNLQWLAVEKGKRMKVCTRCIRTKQKAK